MLKNGYFPQFELFRVPILIHWSYPIGAILLAVLIGDQKISHIFPVIYSYTLLILIHELGHAFFAKMGKAKILKITLDGLGGWCSIEEPRGFWPLLLFYCGGLVAQLVLLLITILIVSVLGKPSTEELHIIVFVFTYFNALLMVTCIKPYARYL